MSDPVNKPAHYNQGGIETIDSIRASTGDGFIWYCVGNADKYIGRCRYKGKLLEDLRKCRNYVDWAIEEAEKLEAAVECGNCPVIPDSSSRRLRQCCSPIAIPTGWRELEPDEVPKSTDMHEWMGGWFFRKDDATHEYKWHCSRHIRKIETPKPEPLAIPEGWRELEPDEVPRVTDLYENEGVWRNRINDSSIEYARYEVRHIRKIEAANTSEVPNSSLPVAELVKGLSQAMQHDQDLAWTWHCSIATASCDEGACPSVANLAAARFMRIAFGVDVTTFDQWKSAKRASAQLVAETPDHIADANKMVPPAIPAGWRELFDGETRSKTDLYCERGRWKSFVDFDPAGSDFPKYDKTLHCQHIRKIETANTSETPNSSIPDPGPGYRLLSKEPPEQVMRGDEFWQNFNREWVESENFIHEGGPQAPELYYRRKIEAAS